MGCSSGTYRLKFSGNLQKSIMKLGANLLALGTWKFFIWKKIERFLSSFWWTCALVNFSVWQVGLPIVFVNIYVYELSGNKHHCKESRKTGECGQVCTINCYITVWKRCLQMWKGVGELVWTLCGNKPALQWVTITLWGQQIVLEC